MDYWAVFFIIFIARMFLWTTTKYGMHRRPVRIEVWVGIFVYGLVRTILHFLGGIFTVLHAMFMSYYYGRPRQPERPRVAETVSDIVSVHSLDRPFEVVLGFRNKRPIKVDFRKHHTVIGSSTGGGKTNLLNSILIQLFSKGARFTSVADVHLIDLKGDEYDYLNLWTPLLKGYATIDASGIGSAISMLSSLVDRMESGLHRDRHVLLIIDEMAMLTALAADTEQGRTATRLLARLMSQFRTWGTVIGAVQYARYDIVPTPIRSNMDRKVCLPVEGKDHAKTILGMRPERAELPWRPGQFLLNEPGVRELIHGQAMLVRLPDEVERCVRNAMVGEMSDPRLILFQDVAGHRIVGAPIDGIRKVCASRVDFTQAQVQSAYRNFALAGALTPPGKPGESYLLAKDYLTAAGLVKSYLAQGRWMDQPDAFVEVDRNGK